MKPAVLVGSVRDGRFGLEVSPDAPAPEEGTPAATPSPSGLVDRVDAASRTEPPPEEAAWDIGVTKGKKGELLLFLLTSDPDVRDTYCLTKDATTASP
ncbi:hypothetical protein [Streptomyces sp. NPDC056672]|uniref:hypothetical protein n=1 Tax=Streptomyces sp. NPDC056672 TaxID=3345906 RepID=UPI0036A3644B